MFQKRMIPIWIGWTVLVIVISIIAAAQPPAHLRDIVSGSSTDLVNLRQRPVAVLLASAFVISFSFFSRSAPIQMPSVTVSP